MVTSNLVGGLGNYLFQIAATYSLALDNKDSMVYDINDNIIVHKPLNSYLSNIFSRINFSNEKLNIEFNYYEPHFHYHSIEYRPNLKLNGYFQSEKYFLHNKKSIIDLFKMDEVTKSYIDLKYKLQEETVSLHVRRGDYLKYPNHHPTCDIDYYRKAVEYIGNDKIYLIFSDDISWCKQNFDFIEKKMFIEGNTDFQDLYLMSLCKDNIIANSSFSWWGAWMNENPNKRVIAPKKWFGPAINHDTKDLIPNTWIKL